MRDNAEKTLLANKFARNGNSGIAKFALAALLKDGPDLGPVALCGGVDVDAV